MGWFRRRDEPELPRGRTRLSAGGAGTDQIRNLAMAVVLMWGPSRELSAVDRLLRLVDGLDQQAAERMVADARDAEQIANNHVYTQSDYTGPRVEFPPREHVDPLVLARFPWVDEDNLGHVYSQSCYHAWHG